MKILVENLKIENFGRKFIKKKILMENLKKENLMENLQNKILSLNFPEPINHTIKSP
jgi:hypothetical protein